jgi:hypothetical protein
MGVFVKIRIPGYFPDFMNYFSIGNIVEYVHGLMDQVHDGRFMGSRGSLNDSCQR